DESVFDNVRGEAETIAGLMLELTGEIPEKDKVIRFGDFIFRIEAVDRRRVLEVQVEIITKNDNLE
ncbi:MAG TPA: transporter associated domain-containing protein, partial [Bacteroidales bacterium]|nr:transporter associated domain-containing protein [Bacteroidales bacterium]